MALNIFAVFFGGAFGALFRYLLTLAVPLNKFGIPITIMLVNFVGCLFMGFMDSISENRIINTHLKNFIMVGVLGGFTTFSTFSLEFSDLLKQGNVLPAFFYAIASVVTALAGFFIGYALAKILK